MGTMASSLYNPAPPEGVESAGLRVRSPDGAYRYTFDVIGELFFGGMFGFLKGEDHQSWIAALDSFMPAFSTIAVAPTYARPFLFGSLLFNRQMKAAAQCIRTMEAAARQGVAKRQAELRSGGQGRSHRDLLQQMINIHKEKGDNVDFSMREVEQEVWVSL